jgi:hypothetical protein
MHLTLTEGNGIGALAEPIMDFPRSPRIGNTTNTLGASQSLIATTDEHTWIGEAVAFFRPMNRSVAMISATDEAQALSHPDVVAAIEAAIPELEAWERDL